MPHLRSPSPGSARPSLDERRARLDALPDAEVVEQCASGHELAWEALIRRYRRLVYAIPHRAGLSVEDAEQVFHGTFAKLAESIGKIQDPSRTRAWIVTTARRLTIDTIRGRSARREIADPEVALEQAEDPGELPGEEVERLETRHMVRQALLRLGDRCRLLLRLLFYDRSDPPRSYGSIARELGMPIGSLGPTRARCLAKLLEELEGVRGASPGDPPGRVSAGG